MIYAEKPQYFVANFDAVGCFVEAQGDILQLLRPNSARIEPGKWGAPAGKVEAKFKENPQLAMARELKEETGLIVFPSKLELVKVFYVEYTSCGFVYNLFRLVFPFKPTIKLSSEHVAYVWIPPAYANSLNLMLDEWECIKSVYNI